MLTDNELLTLAGKAAFARGRTYCAGGRIALSDHDNDGLVGEAEGSELYPLWLKREGADWRWDCACPAADGGAFCKHLVAAVLTTRQASADGDDGDGADRCPPGGSAKRSDELAVFLRAQPAERLAGWLLALAGEDPAIGKRLRLYRAADDPDALKTALGRLLDTGGFLDYRRSIAYARRLQDVVSTLEDAVTRDATTGRSLCDYVLGRLQKIYARCDDSAGAIGGQLTSIADLHARACAAVPPGKALAKPLLALQRKDEWDMFALEAYWEALGSDGQAAYGKLVLAEFATLPEKATDAERWGESAGIARRTEAFARASGDFDLLQCVLRRRLSHPHDYLRVLDSLREFGRDREALAWAEQAAKRFPKDIALRHALADSLIVAGLNDEAVEQRWQAFCLRPDTANWDALKRNADASWPAWRERALNEVAAHERGDSSQRVTLLEHDGDLDAAVTLAREQPIRYDMLGQLARRIEQQTPAIAGLFYLRVATFQMERVDAARYPELVRALKSAARCLPATQWHAVVANVRAEHSRKSKLMKLLDEAGL